jgi:hypothetical protein
MNLVYIDNFKGDSALVAGLRQANERLRAIIEDHDIILCASCETEEVRDDGDMCLSCRMEAAERREDR